MMEQLKALVERHGAKTRPASMESIRALEAKLGFRLPPEYTSFLSTFGVIVFGSAEVYGLGVPDTYYLNVGNSFADLSRDPTYPRNAVPVLDAGDGRYYLYDTAERKLILWATPNGGIVQVLDDSLDGFLADRIFHAA
jgi:hypothetical protein